MAKDFYSLETRVNVLGFPMANVFHYEITDPTESNEFEVAGQLINALAVGAGITSWLARYVRTFSEECYISNIIARRISPAGGNAVETVLQIDSQPGIRSGAVMATQVACAVIWVQDTVEKVTGRTFIPGISISDIDGGRFTSAYQTAVNDFITKHLAGFTVSAGVFLPTIFHRLTEVGYPIDHGYISPKPGTQRRRERPL